MTRQEIIEQLQQNILNLQGNQKQKDEKSRIGLGHIESAFPGKVFPLGAIHEFISFSSESASSTNGFISMIIGKLMHEKGFCIWVSNKRKIFPPALKAFGIIPEQILFVDAWKSKDMLWSIEEALKCDAVTAVVGEIGELGFNDSRRLQLAVEKSNVTGFIHRQQPKAINPLASVSRWKINPVSSLLPDQIPGVGFPRWEVELLKVKNGTSGKWIIQWSPKGLEYIIPNRAPAEINELKRA